jgi:hypothetical protein
VSHFAACVILDLGRTTVTGMVMVTGPCSLGALSGPTLPLHRRRWARPLERGRETETDRPTVRHTARARERDRERDTGRHIDIRVRHTHGC